MKNTKSLFGVVPPVITPVDIHENVDREALKRVIQYVIDGGVHGIFVNGSNGEFYGLDYKNQQAAVETAVEHVNGSVPVYAGASAITTREAVRLSRMAEDAGANALTVLTPMFIQPNEDEMFDHFAAIAASCELPVLLYNNPGKTNNTITPSLMDRLLAIPNIMGVKNTSMDFSMTMKYLELAGKKEGFAVFGGIDYYVYATLVHGGVGAVAGTANVAPRLVSDIYEKFIRGDLEGALSSQKKLIPLRDAYGMGTFPVMMKTMMNQLGLDVGVPIRPVQNVNRETEILARKVLLDLGLLT